MKIYERYELTKALGDPKLPLYVGLECEIESCNTLVKWNIPDVIEVHEDNSLRNMGKEFITPPDTVEKALDSFAGLHKGLMFYNKEQAFSDRTSIHVHANCKNLDEATVKNIVLWYALFEEAFFRMVKPVRRDNIHCVALTDTPLPSAYYRTELRSIHSRWSKYTALNISPLNRLGTIEFRHMHGHDDPVLMEQWLFLISNLFDLGKTTPIAPELLTEEKIQQTYERLFAGTPVLSAYPKASVFTDNTIIDVKLSFI